MYKVTLLPGDGVGPEIAEATRKCIDATGVKIDWDVQTCGIEVIEAEGGVPDRVLEAIRKNDVTIKAPITTPIGKGFRSVNVFLRQELGLYACVRPCKQYKGVRTFFEQIPVDIVLVRENTEDLYAGVEFKAGLEKTARLIGAINELADGKKINSDPANTGVSIKPISVAGTRQIAKYAFDYAVQHQRKSVTSVCKANIMKYTDGLWYDVTRSVALAYKAKFEWEDLAQGVKPDPELAGKVDRHRRQDRLRRTPDRQHVHAACAKARALRCDCHREPLRRYFERPVRGSRRRFGRGSGREHRPRCRHL